MSYNQYFVKFIGNQDNKLAKSTQEIEIQCLRKNKAEARNLEFPQGLFTQSKPIHNKS